MNEMKKRLAEIGVRLGPIVFPHGEDNTLQEAGQRLRNIFAGLADQDPGNIAAQNAYHNLPNNPVDVYTILAASLWQSQGFPSIKLGHKHAASLLATHIPEEAAADISFPWKAFILDLPSGMFQTTDREGNPVPLHNLLVANFRKNNENTVFFSASGLGDLTLYKHAPSLDKVISTAELNTMFENRPAEMRVEKDSEDERTLAAFSRLLLNVCMAAAYPQGLSKLSSKRKNKGKKGKKIDLQTYVLTQGSKITIDCRAEVEDFLKGRASSEPKVRTLTRGHYRRQHFGKNSSETRWQWIEPYWRGPEDGPIAVSTRELEREVSPPTEPA